MEERSRDVLEAFGGGGGGDDDLFLFRVDDEEEDSDDGRVNVLDIFLRELTFFFVADELFFVSRSDVILFETSSVSFGFSTDSCDDDDDDADVDCSRILTLREERLLLTSFFRMEFSDGV